jgi:hypothetical protein
MQKAADERATSSPSGIRLDLSRNRTGHSRIRGTLKCTVLCADYFKLLPGLCRLESQGVANSTKALIDEAAASATKTTIRPLRMIELFDMRKQCCDSAGRVSGYIWC